MSDTLVRLKTIGLDNHGNNKFANFAEMGLNPEMWYWQCIDGNCIWSILGLGRDTVCL